MTYNLFGLNLALSITMHCCTVTFNFFASNLFHISLACISLSLSLFHIVILLRFAWLQSLLCLHCDNMSVVCDDAILLFHARITSMN